MIGEAAEVKDLSMFVREAIASVELDTLPSAWAVELCCQCVQVESSV